MIKPLTETEAAKLLRCTRSKIKELRLAGKLPYLPGPPVLIDEADLTAYVESEKRMVNGVTKAKYDEVRKLARRIWLQRKFAQKAREE